MPRLGAPTGPAVVSPSPVRANVTISAPPATPEVWQGSARCGKCRMPHCHTPPSLGVWGWGVACSGDKVRWKVRCGKLRCIGHLYELPRHALVVQLLDNNEVAGGEPDFDKPLYLS